MELDSAEASNNVKYIKLMGTYGLDRKISFHLELVDDVVQTLSYCYYETVCFGNGPSKYTLDGRKKLIKLCDFTEFDSDWIRFFDFFGRPEEVGVLGDEYTLPQVLELLMPFVFPTVTVYYVEHCECDAELECCQVLSYTKKSVSTIGEMLELVGVKDPRNERYLYTYPDGADFCVCPAGEPFSVRRTCLSDDVEELVQPQPGAYIAHYIR